MSNTYYYEGRLVEKNTRSFEEFRCFVHRFSVKKRARIDQKIEKNGVCEKHTKKTIKQRFLGQFFGQGSILGQFWGPEGDPKIVKNPRPRRNFLGLGSHLGSILAGSPVFTRFWLNFLSILGPSWADSQVNFDISFVFVGVVLQFSMFVYSCIFFCVGGWFWWIGRLVLFLVF